MQDILDAVDLAKRGVNAVDSDERAVWSHNRYDTDKADGSRRNFHYRP
jgi:hypothetical protein